jgi:NADH oxidase (H2O2-forming)
MRVCIVGAGDGGATAANAVRALDSEAQIDVFSKRVSLGCPPCPMTKIIAGTIATWEELTHRRQISSWEKRNISLYLNTEITSIVRDKKYVVAGGERYRYDKLVLALGATPTIPSFSGLDGKNEFTLSTDMNDGIALWNAVGQHTEAAIVGGGFIASEIVVALKTRGYSKVYFLVRRGIMRAQLDKDIAEKLEDVIRQNGVELISPTKVTSITSKGERKRVVLSDQELEVDFVFLGTGVELDVELARRAGLQIGETGAIAVNRYLQTSDPDIYAVGDCMENWDVVTGSKRRHQSATNAIRTGNIAGRNVVLGNTLAYEGTTMPFITKIFDYQIGAVGFTEREARERELEVVSVLVDTPRPRDRFSHYRFIADGKTKALIGAQIVSQETVSATIDKLAVAIASKMPLTKLSQIDNCYSPHVPESGLVVPLHRIASKLG